MIKNNNNEIFGALYEANEENRLLHKEIKEVNAAEAAVYKEIKAIKKRCNMDGEDAYVLDAAIGMIARAYEKQGFLFGMNCKEALGNKPFLFSVEEMYL